MIKEAAFQADQREYQELIAGAETKLLSPKSDRRYL
jgi:hypothetical protein